jgi:hypothetical protein
MPVIPYYRGRPAHVWINAMAPKRRKDPPHLASQLSKRPGGVSQCTFRAPRGRAICCKRPSTR